MASLTSSANVPKQQTVYVSDTSSSSSSSTTTSSDDATLSGAEEQEIASESRSDRLLSRDRSRSGTVATSLHGVLDEAEKTTQRKTLLGE